MILVMGDVVDDIVVRPLSKVTEASDTNAQIRMHAGGSAANVAAWLGHLGASARFLGRAGAAGVGRHTEVLAGFGVDARITGDCQLDTATIVLHLDASGERTMFVDRGANATFTVDDIPADAFDDVDWLHLTGYSLFGDDVRPAALALINAAKAQGIGVSVDPSSVGFLKGCGAAAFLEWVDGVDLVIPNLLEGQFLMGRIGVDDVARGLTKDAGHVVVTMGAQGALYLDAAGRRVDQRAPTTKVVDSTGAGDAFAAGFLSRWVEQRDPKTAMRAGAVAAAEAVAEVGARPMSAPSQAREHS